MRPDEERLTTESDFKAARGELRYFVERRLRRPQTTRYRSRSCCRQTHRNETAFAFSPWCRAGPAVCCRLSFSRTDQPAPASSQRAKGQSECSVTLTRAARAAGSVDATTAAVFYCVVDVEQKRIRYTNAGHNWPILARSNGDCERLSTEDAVLGTLRQWNYYQ
jgi:hypothetical protein